VLAAETPAIPAAPTTYVLGDNVLIDWVEPNDMGSAILGYRVIIRGQNGEGYNYN